MGRSIIRKIIIILSIVFVLFLNRLELFDPLNGVSFSKAVYDRNGELMRLTLSGDEQYRVYRGIDEIDERMVKAVLLNEDRYFYYHWGVNPFSLLRAAFSLNKSRPYGASTVTMQFVRLRDKLYTKNFTGKVWQMLKAIEAEVLYSKKQILEAYLNLTPYGANIEGVGASSLIYFEKSSKVLSLSEVMLLAVIPQNPVKRNLQRKDHTSVYEARDRLYKSWVSEFPDDKWLNQDLKIPVLSQKISELPFRAPHFVNFVTKTSSSVDKDEIHTTLDLKTQSLLEEKLKHYVISKQSIGIKNGAVLLVQKDTKEVRAWVGSKDFFNNEIEGQIDAITTPRSPGSTLKPFLYALALDEGLIHSQTLLYDTPSSFGIYDPENFDRSYKGPISAEQALIQSRNVPAIYLASRLKKKSMYRLLDETDIKFPRSESYYGLAIVLGSAEVTPFQLAGLYTGLANYGRWSPLIWRSQQKPVVSERQLFSQEASFIVLEMLKKNLRSESLFLDDVSKSKISIAWKTGTSYGYRDAWVAGIVGDHVLIVWLGHFDNSGNPALIGREITAPLFFEIVDLLNGKGLIEAADWERVAGLNLKEKDVCFLSGGFSRGVCPHTKKTWFNPGVSPITDCQIHREVLVSKKTGRRICRVADAVEEKREVFEFWPSDIVQLFNKYGLPYKKAPILEEGCEPGYLSQVSAPEIVSPKADLIYSVRFELQKGYDKIPFQAKVDNEVKKLFWFVNQKFIGQALPNEPYFAELSPGAYKITVADDLGNVVSRRVTVKLIR